MKFLFSSTLGSFIVVIGCVAVLVGCNGFEAAKPDPEQIVSLRNSNPFFTSMVVGPAQPTPLPMLIGPPPTVPFVQPPADSRPVSPFGLGEANPSLGALGTPQPIDPNVDPYTALGRLDYVKAGQNWYCSAEIVGDSGDVLMTAAHCVYDHSTGRWNSNWIFRLGEQNGVARDVIDWECTALYSGWLQKAYRKDYAFIKLRGNAPKALGLKGGIPVKNWTSIGYPASYGGGRVPHVVSGSLGAAGDGVIEMVGNPFGGGSSGGAWLSGNFAIGLNSFYYDKVPTSMWGPLFDGQTTRLYEFVRRGCQQDVVPLGQGFELSGRDKNKGYVQADSRAVEYGPKVKLRSSAKCSCPDASEYYLENTSGEEYQASIGYWTLTKSPRRLLVSDRLAMLVQGQGTTERLGCSIGDEEPSTCPVISDFHLLGARRMVDASGSGKPKEPVSPAFCAHQCLSNPDGGYCLSFGNAAKPIVVALAGFITDSLDRTPNSSGVTTTIKELVSAFNGDPRAEDPCKRSDFYRVADNVSNDGIACVTTTPAVDDLPDAARISLRTPVTATALRTSVAGATGSAASFGTRATSPVLEFFGANSSEINRRFGGYLVQIEKRVDRLIVTTENGCSIGSMR